MHTPILEMKRTFVWPDIKYSATSFNTAQVFCTRSEVTVDEKAI